MNGGKGAVAVSGASSGIGLATAVLLAQRGYAVFAGVRTDADARRIAGLHDGLRPVMLDVTDAASIAACAQRIADAGIALCGAISNAGVVFGGPLETVPVEELRQQFEVNVFGALAFVQALLPRLHAGSKIVFVGSISGRLATPYIGPYGASKFALRAIADSLRVELAPAGIAVALVEPGSVKTPIWEKGRASRDRLMQRLGPQSRPHYRAALETVLAQTEREEQTGMPVETVARAIAATLEARRPRAQQLLGMPAQMGGVIATLPAAVRDAIVRSALKLP